MPKDTDNWARGSHCRTKTQHPGGTITGWLSGSQLQGERQKDTQTHRHIPAGTWESGKLACDISLLRTKFFLSEVKLGQQGSRQTAGWARLASWTQASLQLLSLWGGVCVPSP